MSCHIEYASARGGGDGDGDCGCSGVRDAVVGGASRPFKEDGRPHRQGDGAIRRGNVTNFLFPVFYVNADGRGHADDRAAPSETVPSETGFTSPSHHRATLPDHIVDAMFRMMETTAPPLRATACGPAASTERGPGRRRKKRVRVGRVAA